MAFGFVRFFFSVGIDTGPNVRGQFVGTYSKTIRGRVEMISQITARRKSLINESSIAFSNRPLSSRVDIDGA